jgi:hypothetical protein
MASVLAEGVIVGDRVVNAFGDFTEDCEELLDRLLRRQRARAADPADRACA